eukprot:scaffold24735_cov131-Isochrysis_galbana.AAC.2
MNLHLCLGRRGRLHWSRGGRGSPCHCGIASCFIVNTLAHLEEEAVRSVSATMVKLGYPAAQSMAVYGGDFELVFVDILFKYDLHSHFTYHTDDRHGHHPVLAVVVQLTAD